MFNNMDPATKQYLVFSAIVAIILSFIINFALINAFKNTFAYGFPFNLNNVQGFTDFIYRLLDTLVEAVLLTIPVYLGFMWFLRRPR